ncbi:unnamed protein product [Porites lobata]|uniref:Uncharacterized protein n=1 Tax=Porites lobata TaxID=104759 RepID=A0ABN8PSG8_9CNID|nr:unnamed protein product [Porites lobata]
MSKKCFVIKSCLYFVCFGVISIMLAIALSDWGYYGPEPILKVWNARKQSTEEMLLDSTNAANEFISPSVKSFIRASTTDNSLKGLAVYLSLTNACQTLDDVSKAKNQVHKIALVTLMQNNQSTCTLEDLAKNVQNAGYSLLIYFCATPPFRVKNSKNKVMIMIPVATVYDTNVGEVKRIFSHADRTDVDIACLPPNGQQIDYLRKMESYLKRLYFWFLIGPLITLEWMRRTRKFCCMSDSQEEQRVGEERATENEGNAAENEIRTMEEGENGTEEPLASNYQESRGRNPGREVSSQSSEEQPLLVEFTRLPRRNRRSLDNLKLTALRTVAIGLTLKVSFSSSMHIVWKLNKPTESLFEGLSENVEFGPREQTATLTLYPRDEETVVHFELSDVASPDSAPSLETVIQLCQGSDGVRLRVWPCIQTSRMDVSRSMMCAVRYKSTKSPLSQL